MDPEEGTPGREQASEPEEEPPDPFAGIPTQDEYDVAALRGALVEERQAFALAKLRWHVASRFGIKGAHPQSLAKEAAEHAERLGLVEELLAHGPIPPPGKAAAELLVPVAKLEVPEPKLPPEVA